MVWETYDSLVRRTCECVFFYAKRMCSCSGIMVAHEVAETLIQVQLRWTHSILVSQKGRQESQPGGLISLAGLRGQGP